jgi:tetratricopeptide (TPR) repeat protein
MRELFCAIVTDFWKNLPVAESLQGLRVFIASPGGLEHERNRFRATVEEVNREANERGVTFMPVGWEYATPGLGRPQAKINVEVERCDYMVLVLHDRWGTPPATDGTYTSGTEEEYEVARRCAADAGMPMRNIAVLFKGVPAHQLSDPGEQLRKVLAFKTRLEQERSLFFKTFDSPSEFEREVRALLFAWMREEEEGGTQAVGTPGPAPDQPPSAEPLPAETGARTTAELLDRAAQLVGEGRFTEAESLYASAVVARTDVEAMTQYARFLRRNGRLDLARTMSDRLLEVGRARNDARAMIEALSNIAIIARKRGDNRTSLAQLEQAVDIARNAGPEFEGDVAFLLDNIGLTLRKQGDFKGALDRHLEALDIKRRLDDPRSLATTLNHAAALMRQSGRLDEALAMTQEAVRVFEQLEYERGEAQARANLGELHEERGDVESARQEFEASLRLNEKLRSPEGVGMNLWQLGRLALDVGDLDAAGSYAAQALERSGAEGISRPEAVAAPLQLLGNVRVAQGSYREGVEDLELAATIFQENEHALGTAWSYADLALARVHAGDVEGASDSLSRADAIGRALANVRFQMQLERARGAVADAQTEGKSASQLD